MRPFWFCVLGRWSSTGWAQTTQRKVLLAMTWLAQMCLTSESPSGTRRLLRNWAPSSVRGREGAAHVRQSRLWKEQVLLTRVWVNFGRSRHHHLQCINNWVISQIYKPVDARNPQRHVKPYRQHAYVVVIFGLVFFLGSNSLKLADEWLSDWVWQFANIRYLKQSTFKSFWVDGTRE